MVRFIEQEDRKEIQQWLIDNGTEHVQETLDMLPSNGLIVPGFICWHYWLTVDHIAIMEGLITNPHAPVRERISASKELFAVWNELAKKMQLKRYVYMTPDRKAYDWYARFNGSQRADGVFRLYVKNT